VADRYLLESSAVDGYLLEDASGVLLLEVLLPTVYTTGATGIGQTSAYLQGGISNTGGENCDIRGFDYGETTGYGSEVTENGSFGVADYDLLIQSLQLSTLYHFRAKAHNSAGWGYGSDMEFTTLGVGGSVAPRSVGVSPGANTNSCVVVKPVGLAVSDLMVAHISFRGSDAIPSVSAPEGWQTTQSTPFQTNVIGYLRSSLWWKIAVQADVDATNFTFTGGAAASFSNRGAIAAWTGHNPTTPIGASNGQGNAASTTVTSPGITPSVANCMILLFTAIDDNNTQSAYAIATSNPASWSEAYDLPSDLTYDIGLSMGYALRPETSATGNGTATTSASDANIGQLVAIAPAGGVPTTVTPDTLALDDVEYAPVLKFGIIPSTLALNDTEYNAVTGYGYVPTTLAFTGTKYIPVLKYGIIPSTLALDDVEYVPVLKFGIIPSTLALTTTKYIPVLKEVTTPITLALNDTEYIPILKHGIIPTTLALNDTEYIPVLGFGIIPSTLALNDTEYNAVIGYGYVPTTLSLITTKYAPVLQAKIIAGLLSLSIVSFAPSPSIGLYITPDTLAFTTTKYIPTLKFAYIQDTLVLTTTAYAPSIISPFATIITPETLALITSKYASVLELGITPETESLLLSFFNPPLGFGIIAPVVNLNDTEYTPSIYIYKKGSKSITAIYADRSQRQTYPDRSQSIFDSDKNQNQSYPDRSQSQSFPDRSQNQETYTEG